MAPTSSQAGLVGMPATWLRCLLLPTCHKVTLFARRANRLPFEVWHFIPHLNFWKGIGEGGKYWFKVTPPQGVFAKLATDRLNVLWEIMKLSI